MRFLLLLFLANQLGAQTTTLSGIINHYAAVTAFDTCSGALSVSDTTGFRAGGAVWVLQAQGAQIAAGNAGSYGQIQNMYAAGRYERAVVDSVTAATLFLKNHLINDYGFGGRVQVISIAQYADVVVADTVRAQAWNGETGGVLALEVSGALTLNAPLSADGAGFRGGAPYFVALNNCNFAFPQTFYYYGLGSWRGGYKGEGIALPIAGKELGRGPQANGGGGGNDHNSGGGGGGHIYSAGRGGDNNEPSPLGCSGQYPGFGGYGMTELAERLFFGGGGGAGHANNGLTTAGSNGGGLVLVIAARITGSNPTISANGQSAPTGDGDGGGGGGAGGSIWVQAAAADSNLIVRANGGNGGNTTNNGSNRCAGPGGGGSGGRILTNLSSLLNMTPPEGGQPGVITNSPNACNGSSAGAESGAPGVSHPTGYLPQGTVAYAPPVVTTAPQSRSACVGTNALFTVHTDPGAWNYQWQILDNGSWQDLPSGTQYNGVQRDSLQVLDVTPGQDSARYRVVISLNACTQTVSPEALLTVNALPTAGFTPSVNGTTVTFSNQSTEATTYWWDFGDGDVSTSAGPEHTYAQEGIYTVTLLAVNVCDTAVATQLLVLLTAPTANFAVADSTAGCLSAVVVFQNLSSANTAGYQWSFPGGLPATSTLAQPSVSYSISGTYTAQLIVTNPAGQDTLVRSFEVQVAALPVANFDYSLLPGGVVQFSNQSPAGGSFTWDFGDGTPLLNSENASHQYTQSGTYVVTLSVSNPCGGAILQQNVAVTVEGVGTGPALHLGRVRLFPNPVQDRLTVDCSAADVLPTEIRLYDAAGRVSLRLRDGLLPVTNISMAGQPAGAYTIVVYFEQGKVVRIVAH